MNPLRIVLLTDDFGVSQQARDVTNGNTGNEQTFRYGVSKLMRWTDTPHSLESSCGE